MPLPPLGELGELPPGVHQATLRETIDRFGTSTTRRHGLAVRLQRIYHLAAATGHLARFIVFSSFVTAKPEPNDVAVFLLMENAFDYDQVTGETRYLFDHWTAQTYFGCSVFWVRRLAALNGEQATIEYWQVKRDGTWRGIVELISEA
ncbi:MAG: DUF6932 family protein [Ardenticatenaceae bacterium]